MSILLTTPATVNLTWLTHIKWSSKYELNMTDTNCQVRQTQLDLGRVQEAVCPILGTQTNKDTTCALGAAPQGIEKPAQSVHGTAPKKNSTTICYFYRSAHCRFGPNRKVQIQSPYAMPKTDEPWAKKRHWLQER